MPALPPAPSGVESPHPAKGRINNANTLTQFQMKYLMATSRIQEPNKKNAIAMPGDSEMVSAPVVVASRTTCT
jgi:hypothetical protein